MGNALLSIGLLLVIFYALTQHMNSQQLDYRQFLKEVLLQKCAKNSRYSMRAFAKQIGISASHLSRVINGQKDISAHSALKIGLELKLNDQELEHFLDLVNFETADSHTQKMIQSRINERVYRLPKKTIEMEMFKVIADWYHLPLFELMKSKRFVANEQWIAKRLSLSLVEVKTAIDRLEYVGLIKRMQNGYEILEADVQTSDDVASIAIKKHHEQMSHKAVEALSCTVDEREFQSLQLCFDQKNLKKAKKRIRDFVSKFDQEFKTNSSQDIYQMNLQFFNLTKNKESK